MSMSSAASPWHVLASAGRWRSLSLIACVALLLRALVAVNFSYSGAGVPPMFGDFEAQRHWLEITRALPIGDWYRATPDNDLQYWGLDYPPLTAYHSWALAQVASRVEPELVALHASRGHESLSGKLFMRYTVLVADLLVFFTAVLALLPALHRNAARFLRPIEAAIGGPSTATDIRTSGDVGDGGDESLFDESHADGGSGTDAARGLLAIALALAHPAYILIDHGHFQYNCVCLGLVLWAVHHLVHGRELVGSVCFVAALGYKQMALYFAPSFFCYLAGRAWQRSGGSLNRFVLRVAVLGAVVIGSFALILLPLMLHPNGSGIASVPVVVAASNTSDSNATHTAAVATTTDALGALEHVLHRVFPIARGLYEDKVANFWCATGALFRWKERFAAPALLRAAGAATIAALLPAGVAVARAPTAARFVTALGAQAFAFFLFSFQVHEKTILLPLLPLLIVAFAGRRSLFFFAWLSAVAVFSMYPLLFKDGLALPYATLQLAYAVFAFQRARAPSRLLALACGASLLGCAALHAAAVWAPPPPRYPDLHLLACAAYAFAHFAAACVGLNVLVWRLPTRDDEDGPPAAGGSDAVAPTAVMKDNASAAGENGSTAAAAAVTASIVVHGDIRTGVNHSNSAVAIEDAVVATKASPRRLRQRRPPTSGAYKKE